MEAIRLKIKIKKTNFASRSSGSLQLFKVCGKMQLIFCVAKKTIPISFHQCLSVKTCFKLEICQKFSYNIYFPIL